MDSKEYIAEVTVYNNFVKDAVTKFKTPTEAKEQL